MSAKDRFSAQERAPYMAYFDDGLWDIWLGLLLLMAGMGLLTQEFNLLVILLALAAPFMWEAKRRMTVPRLAPMRYNAAQFAADERRKSILLTTASVALFIGILVFITATYRPGVMAWLRPFNGLPWGVLLALAVGLVGYLYRALNWAVYAFMLMTLTLASAWFGFSFAVCLVFAGALILLSGIGLLFHFWHQHAPLAFL